MESGIKGGGKEGGCLYRIKRKWRRNLWQKKTSEEEEEEMEFKEFLGQHGELGRRLLLLLYNNKAWENIM